VLTEDVKSFTDLVGQGSGTFQEVEKFSVVHFQEHTGDLSGKLGLLLLDLGEQVFTDHLFFSALLEQPREPSRSSQWVQASGGEPS
jgi:hypothetical protein